MKPFLTITIFLAINLLPSCGFSQTERILEENLLRLFEKIKDYREDHKLSITDTAKLYNAKFEVELLKKLQSNPETINYNFKSLRDAGLHIITSADKRFRIYSWDDMQGGTMRYANNVYQTQAGNSQKVQLKEDDGFINSIDTLKAKGVVYYIVTKTFAGSSVIFLHSIEVFTIQNINASIYNAPVIKTTTHFTSKITCDVDYGLTVNSGTKIIKTNILYSLSKRKIALPLILENGKITEDKILYHFNGKYFERKK